MLAWVLSAGAAVVLGTTMLVAASLQAWPRDRGVYRPLARTCAVVAVACVGVGAIRPAPLVLGPRARCPDQHSLGTRRRPPPGRPGRLTRSSPKLITASAFEENSAL